MSRSDIAPGLESESTRSPPDAGVRATEERAGPRRRSRLCSLLLPRLPWIYACGLLVVAALALAGPYAPADGDLWYHLAHGRHIVETGDVPTTSYFSYQVPERQWVDYYWLFQVLVYGLWWAGGPTALWALRAVGALAFLIVLWRFLTADGRAHRSPLWISLIFGLASEAVWYRLTVLRPHTVSYLALLLALAIWERGERQRWWLIPLALAWVNVHGIYFPILILIVIAYGSEWLLGRFRGRLASSLTTPLAALATLLAVFLTPHGRSLIAVPYTPTIAASAYIAELTRLPFGRWWDFELRAFQPGPHSSALVLLLLAAVAIATTAWQRRLRLAHLVLVFGSALLLLRAGRFTTDLSILVLPILRDLGPAVGIDQLWNRKRPAGVLLAALALAPAYVSLARHVDLRSGPRIDIRATPDGAATFIRQAGTPGRVMNHPNDGGYLLWALPPQNPIFSDMEIPFLFHDEDMLEITRAYGTADGLATFLERHRPSILVIPFQSTAALDLIGRHTNYRPVYFDDQSLVCVDRLQQPAVVASWDLRMADPAKLVAGPYDALGPEQRARLRSELERLDGVGRRSAIVAIGLARLAIADGDPERAEATLLAAARSGVADSRLTALRAEARSALGDHRQAAELYRRVIAASDNEDERKSAWRGLAAELSALGQPRQAYRALRQAVGAFDVTAPAEDYLALADAAHLAGRTPEAWEYLAWVDRILAPDDPRRSELERRRSTLDAPASD